VENARVDPPPVTSGTIRNYNILKDSRNQGEAGI